MQIRRNPLRAKPHDRLALLLAVAPQGERACGAFLSKRDGALMACLMRPDRKARLAARAGRQGGAALARPCAGAQAHKKLRVLLREAGFDPERSLTSNADRASAALHQKADQ
jgi:hypothetical protein